MIVSQFRYTSSLRRQKMNIFRYVTCSGTWWWYEQKWLWAYSLCSIKNCRKDFGNYRTIYLLCHAYWLFSAVIARRLRTQLVAILPESQVGFRPAHGTRNNDCILKWTMKMIRRENQKDLITCIDNRAAFDTESQKFLDNALNSANVSIKVRRIIQSIFRVASGCASKGNNTFKTFNILRGVLQGDIFFPVAFIVSLWKIFTDQNT